MSLGNYQFLPWLREGVGNTITEVDTLNQGGTIGGRAKLTMEMNVNLGIAGKKEFQIVGPADVIGFSRDLVIKTEPVNWSTTFAPNLLAHIEFYDEDFIWRYSPAKANGQKLRPWLSLIVLKEKEFSRKDATVPLPQIEVLTPSVLPPFGETWLWGHVQKIESSSLPSDKNLSDLIISRLICPRKLQANTGYFAFVVPTFESGRLAGLGKTEEDISKVNSQDPAWGIGIVNPILPVYYEWFFRTAEEMDFEYLASLLEAKQSDPLVGRKPLDCKKPGFGIPEYQNEFTVYIEGALKVPDSLGQVNISNVSATNLSDFQSRIKTLLDLSVQSTGDPVVTPPFYGQKHIFEKILSLTGTQWIHKLNKDPAFRAAAGLGTKVFRKYQDHYLLKAWEQVESINEANKIIDTGKTSLAVSKLLYEKNIINLPVEEMIALAGPVHVKVKVPGVNGKESTLSEEFRKSCFNGSAYSNSFRRLTSRRSSFRRKLEQGGGPLDLEALKKLMISRTNAPFTLLERGRYKVLFIDRPGFKPTFRPAFEDRIIALSPAEFDATVNAFGNMIKDPPPKKPCVPSVGHTLLQNINPSIVLTRLLGQVLQMPVTGWFDDPLNIKPALAYPDFEDPMYEKLKEISADWLAPNLDLIPNNSITLLQSNRKFIEAFLVGVNVAMNQEMRWREYPTDERASCFRQFWDVKGVKDVHNPTVNLSNLAEQYKDISPIHTWRNWRNEVGKEKLDEFGAHNTRTILKEDEQLVLVVRGDLLKCFPNTSIYAVEAEEKTMQDGSKKLMIKTGGEIRFPQFKAEAGADLKFIGFELTLSEAKGILPKKGWFFVFQETPGETRFGLDINGPSTTTNYTWDDASWQLVNGDTISIANQATITNTSQFESKLAASEKNPDGSPKVKWGRSSADMAFILYQKPVMIAIHANEMLP